LDALLGLVLLAAYVLGMVGFAAAVTLVVIKIFPTRDRPEQEKKAEKASEDGAPAGRLFRRSKRDKT
jgi:hypothetical protein